MAFSHQDSTDSNDNQKVVIYGQDNNHGADVELISGKRRILTDAIVTVEQLFGKPGYASSWFALGTFTDSSGIGSDGNTVRVQIVAGKPSAIYPAVDYTYTITSGDVSSSTPEISVRDGIISGLNNNANFAISFKAQAVKDNGIVFIRSKIRGEMGDRPLSNDIQVTATGTTVVTLAFDNITRRGTETELDRSPEDPRQGVLAVSGTVSVTPGALSNRLVQDLTSGGSNALNVNGSVTPVTFQILSDSVYDIYITELRIHGRGNGIQFGKFLNLNGKLTNGITFDVKSDNQSVQINTIKSTDDLKSRFSAIDGFDLDIQSGGDHLLATNSFGLQTPLVIRKTGTFASSDYLKLIINDNLTQVAELFSTIIGFRRLP